MTDYERDMRIQKARARRFMKPLSKEFNIESIQNTIWDILNAASDIKWMDTEDVLSQLLEDDEEANEFKNAFGILEGDAYAMSEALRNDYVVPECFDLWFASMGRDLMGFDKYEGDYFDLEPGYDESLAHDAAKKRLMTMTKKEILDASFQCFRIAVDYLSIKKRYEDLQDALEILRGKNCEQLKIMDELDKLYDAIQLSEGFMDGERVRRFNRLAEELQPEVWV